MWEPLYPFHNRREGNLRGGKYGVRYGSGVSFQNQLMILGGSRGREEDDPLSYSLLFDENSGETQLLRDMTFVYYFRPQMILVDSAKIIAKVSTQASGILI